MQYFDPQALPRTLDSIYNAYLAQKQQTEGDNEFYVNNGFKRSDLTDANVRQAMSPQPTRIASPVNVPRQSFDAQPQGPLRQPPMDFSSQPERPSPLAPPGAATELAPEDHVIGAIRAHIAARQQKQSLDTMGSQAEIGYKLAQANKLNSEANGGDDKHYNLDQAASLITAPGEDQSKTKDSLSKLYPGGKVPKDYAHIAATNNRSNMNLGLRDDQFDVKEWEEINKRANPAVAPRGSLLGTAGTVNARADRAIQTLNSKQVTNQMLSGIAADIAGMLKGGTPDQQAEKEQGYGSLYGDIIKAESYLTGVPKDAIADPKLIEHLRGRINELKKVDNKIIQDNLDATATVHEGAIRKGPERWKKFRANITGTTTGIAEQGQAAGTPQKIGRFTVVPE